MNANTVTKRRIEMIFSSCSSFLITTGHRRMPRKMTYGFYVPKKSFSVILSAMFTAIEAVVWPNSIRYISIRPTLLNMIIPQMKNIDRLPNSTKPISNIDSGFPGMRSLAPVYKTVV